jgi:hypothetical protein
MHAKLWSENLKGGVHLKVVGIDGRIILEFILEELGGKVWASSIWLRTGTSGRLL